MVRTSTCAPRRQRLVGSHDKAQLDGLPIQTRRQIDHRVDVSPGPRTTPFSQPAGCSPSRLSPQCSLPRHRSRSRSRSDYVVQVAPPLVDTSSTYPSQNISAGGGSYSVS